MDGSDFLAKDKEEGRPPDGRVLFSNPRPRVPMPPRLLLDPAVVDALVREKHALVFTFVDPDRPIRQVDLFLTPELGYDRLAPESEWLDLDGIAIRVLSKRKLLELKLGIHPARAKDLADIEFLRRHVDL